MYIRKAKIIERTKRGRAFRIRKSLGILCFGIGASSIFTAQVGEMIF
jgi:hypothetical protein